MAMASKQLGKLRQWGREVISTKEKTVFNDEFRELEQDIDLRRAGIERLYDTCTEYHTYLQKKKEYPTVVEGVKMLPIDAMGAIMMAHGEEFGDDSAFGQCLQKFGRAHCKIATIQESYALTFRTTYLVHLESIIDELKDYTVQRKKLDSRRLAYDAARTRSSKAKKEKEVKEAEEELSKARLRFEETSTDVQERMHTIREKEIQQLHGLTEFLAMEIRFTEQYLEVLRDTKADWVDESAIVPPHVTRRKSFSQAAMSGRSTPSISSTAKTSTSTRNSVPATDDTTNSELDGHDEDYGGTVKPRTSSSTSRPSSRGSVASSETAHNSRRRRDSGATAVSDGGGSASMRMTVAGWASNAVSSLGRNKKDFKKDKAAAKKQDKEARRAFASLENDGSDSSNDGEPVVDNERELPQSFGASNQTLSSTRERNAMDSSSISSNSASGSTSVHTPKTMRALYDFTGGPDELSFCVGDKISVVSEVEGSWSIGELAGKRGFFPTNYTEEIVSRIPPLVPRRTLTDIAKRAQEDSFSEDAMSIASADGPHVGLYDTPFGDHHFAKSPLVAEHYPDVTTDDDEDETRGLFTERPISSMPDITSASSQRPRIGNMVYNDMPTLPLPQPLPQRKHSERKPPPPPPARRSTFSSTSTPVDTSHSGGPSVSAPSSTSNPPVTSSQSPPAPRRSISHQASNSLNSSSTLRASVSPFDN